MTKNKRIMRVATTLILTLTGALVIFAGCPSRQSITNKMAAAIVGDLDTYYAANLKSEPAKDVSTTKYCMSVSMSTATAVKENEVKLAGYDKAVGSNPAGQEIATKIRALHGNLKACAYVRCKTAIGVNIDAPRDFAKKLGMDAGTAPPADSCKQYEKLSAEILKTVSN